MRSRNFCSAALAAVLLIGFPLGAAHAAGPVRGDGFRPLDLLHTDQIVTRAPAVDAGDAGAARFAESAGALRVEGDAGGSGVATAPGAKSSRKALLYSMLLPGAGELYLGNRGRALGFFVAEGSIWANYVAWQISGHLRKNDYIEQARINAGIGISAAADDYWRLLGQYQRSSGTGPDAYEESLRRDARLQYPDNPTAQDLYVAERLPSGKSAWSWDSPALQQSYIETRRSANRAFNRAKISFAVAVLNRIVSAVDTQILSRSRHERAESSRDGTTTQILTALTADGGGALLIQRRF